MEWSLSARLAVEAGSNTQARDIIDEVLSRLRRPLPVEQYSFAPASAADGIWIATLQLRQGAIGPGEDATSRCRYVANHFGPSPTWSACKTEHAVRWDWPPDIFTRQVGEDEMLLHPALKAVRIVCGERLPDLE